MKLNTLLLAGMAVTLGVVVAGGAKADTIYTQTGAPATVTTTATTTAGQEVVSESYRAVGTRKVGMVGYRAYPMQASHVESSTVRTIDPTTTVSYSEAPGTIIVPGAAAATSTSVSTTTAGKPIAYSTGGGNYYTERGTRAYADPALNIDVRSTGSFND